MGVRPLPAHARRVDAACRWCAAAPTASPTSATRRSSPRAHADLAAAAARRAPRPAAARRRDSRTSRHLLAGGRRAAASGHRHRRRRVLPRRRLDRHRPAGDHRERRHQRPPRRGRGARRCLARPESPAPSPRAPDESAPRALPGDRAEGAEPAVVPPPPGPQPARRAGRARRRRGAPADGAHRDRRSATAPTSTRPARRLRTVCGLANFAVAGTAAPDVAAITEAVLRDLPRTRVVPSFRVEVKRAHKQFPVVVAGSRARDRQPRPGRDRLEGRPVRSGVRRSGSRSCRRRAYYYFDKEPGAGGLPVGTAGRVLVLLSGGIDSPVAAWRMIRRGCHATFVHFHGHPFTSRASIDKVRELVRRAGPVSARRARDVRGRSASCSDRSR